MNCDNFSLVKQENFDNDFISNNKDSFNQYLHNPNLSVLSMTEKYDVPKLVDKHETGKKKKDLQCTVCGARAFGYNFDQITCESCKAFFRRNAPKNINDLICRFDGSCNIITANRRHCTHCRIKKCFAIGMRKEWIRSEEEKLVKRTQLEMHRKAKEITQPMQMLIVEQAGGSKSISVLSAMDKMRLNNVTHCYDHYTGEPTILSYCPPKEVLSLRLHDFYNRKKPVIISFINYFKHLPEFQQLHVDDQVLLIKQNIHCLLPINYALLKTPVHSQVRYTYIETIGCINNINLHAMYQCLSNSFVPFVEFDPLLIKLLLITLFFTAHTQTTNFDTIEYKQTADIKQIQSNYIELLWLYTMEKHGEEQAVQIFIKVITKFTRLQIMIAQIDLIIRLNNDSQHIDSLLKTVLRLT